MWKKGRRGEIGGQAAYAAQVALVAALVTTVDERGSLGLALERAFELDRPIYDCIYLALAVGRKDVLVAADHRFLRRVQDPIYAGNVRALDGRIMEQPRRP